MDTILLDRISSLTYKNFTGAPKGGSRPFYSRQEKTFSQNESDFLFSRPIEQLHRSRNEYPSPTQDFFKAVIPLYLPKCVRAH